jgi:hypothetical protein
MKGSGMRSRCKYVPQAAVQACGVVAAMRCVHLALHHAQTASCRCSHRLRASFRVRSFRRRLRRWRPRLRAVQRRSERHSPTPLNPLRVLRWLPRPLLLWRLRVHLQLLLLPLLPLPLHLRLPRAVRSSPTHHTSPSQCNRQAMLPILPLLQLPLRLFLPLPPLLLLLRLQVHSRLRCQSRPPPLRRNSCLALTHRHPPPQHRPPFSRSRLRPTCSSRLCLQLQTLHRTLRRRLIFIGANRCRRHLPLWLPRLPPLPPLQPLLPLRRVVASRSPFSSHHTLPPCPRPPPLRTPTLRLRPPTLPARHSPALSRSPHQIRRLCTMTCTTLRRRLR